MKRTNQAAVALFAIGVAAQSPTGIILGSTTRVTNPSDTGVVTVSYPVCPSATSTTVTAPVSTYTGGPLNQYGYNGQSSVYATTLYLPCPSATNSAGWLTPMATTITEPCPCMSEGVTRAPDYVPAGMTTSIATCTVCGESSPTATCLVPTAGPSGASSAGTGAGSGTPGSSGSGSGSPGSGSPGSGSGSSGSDPPGSGTPGSPGSGSSGSGSGAPGSGSGAGSPGAGSPGAGSPGAGSPGAGSPGAGSPAGSAAAGAGTNPSASLLAESPNAPYGSNSTAPTSGAGSSAGSAVSPLSSFSGAIKVDALSTFLLALAGSIGLFAWQL